MTTLTKRPFYLRPPWNILFEVNKLEKLTPWNVNIDYLLLSFLAEMDKTGKVDFRASGVALDSSALIYLMKAKLLLTLQEPPEPPKAPLDFVPPPLFLPLRQELTSTTIRNLLEVLDDVLKTEKMVRPDRVVSQPVLPTMSEILPQLDSYLIEIEVKMDQLYALLCEKVKGTGIIEFSTLIEGMARIEAVRNFMLLLFLAQGGRIQLWQTEEDEDVFITIGKLNFTKDIEKSD